MKYYIICIFIILSFSTIGCKSTIPNENQYRHVNIKIGNLSIEIKGELLGYHYYLPAEILVADISNDYARRNTINIYNFSDNPDFAWQRLISDERLPKDVRIIFSNASPCSRFIQNGKCFMRAHYFPDITRIIVPIYPVFFEFYASVDNYVVLLSTHELMLDPEAAFPAKTAEYMKVLDDLSLTVRPMDSPSTFD